MNEGKDERMPTGSSEQADVELDGRVTELAIQTKEKGIGQIFGYALPIEVGGTGHMGFQNGPGFALGENVSSIQAKDTLQNVIPNSYSTVHDLVGDERYEDNPKQVWLSEKFTPPAKRWETKSGGLLRKKVETHEEVVTFNGKHGAGDWIMYSYYIPTVNKTSRGGDFVQLTVVVPPELAIRIDGALEEDVYFPDKYFRSLFPNVIGRDDKNSMVRRSTTKLLVVNRRENPQNNGELRNYPQPIEA